MVRTSSTTFGIARRTTGDSPIRSPMNEGSQPTKRIGGRFPPSVQTAVTTVSMFIPCASATWCGGPPVSSVTSIK